MLANHRHKTQMWRPKHIRDFRSPRPFTSCIQLEVATATKDRRNDRHCYIYYSSLFPCVQDNRYLRLIDRRIDTFRGVCQVSLGN